MSTRLGELTIPSGEIQRRSAQAEQWRTTILEESGDERESEGKKVIREMPRAAPPTQSRVRMRLLAGGGAAASALLRHAMSERIAAVRMMAPDEVGGRDASGHPGDLDEKVGGVGEGIVCCDTRIGAAAPVTGRLSA
jgi:hypothetical protein